METSRINEVRATQRSVRRRVQYRRVVVRHLEIPSTTAAEDQQRRPRKNHRFTKEEEVRELHRRTLKAHHPVGDRRL